MGLMCIGGTTRGYTLCTEWVTYRASVAADKSGMFSMSVEQPAEYLPPRIQIALRLYHYLRSFLHRLEEVVELGRVLYVAFAQLSRIVLDHKRTDGHSDCLMTGGAPATPFDGIQPSNTAAVSQPMVSPSIWLSCK